MTSDFTPEGDSAATPEPSPSPWAPLEERGFRPDGFEPDDVVNGANFWKALRSRDYQDGAITQVLRHAGFPEDVTPAELRELAQQARAGQDPWAQFDDGGYDDSQQYQQPQFDPRQMQQAVEAAMDQRFAAFTQQQEQARTQAAYEAEFTRELERAAAASGFEADEKLWLAARANELRQTMPYATTAEVMDKAAEGINNRMMARLQALAARQGQAPAAPLPGGLQPADQQVPQNAAEAAAMWRQRSGG